MTVDLRGAAYAASRTSSTLKGSTKQFGWLQASATKASSLSITSANPAPSKFVIFFAKDVENSSPTPTSTPIHGQIISGLPVSFAAGTGIGDQKLFVSRYVHRTQQLH
jgi:hypothetical protein